MASHRRACLWDSLERPIALKWHDRQEMRPCSVTPGQQAAPSSPLSFLSHGCCLSREMNGNGKMINNLVRSPAPIHFKWPHLGWDPVGPRAWEVDFNGISSVVLSVLTVHSSDLTGCGRGCLVYGVRVICHIIGHPTSGSSEGRWQREDRVGGLRLW